MNQQTYDRPCGNDGPDRFDHNRSEVRFEIEGYQKQPGPDQIQDVIREAGCIQLSARNHEVGATNTERACDPDEISQIKHLALVALS